MERGKKVKRRTLGKLQRWNIKAANMHNRSQNHPGVNADRIILMQQSCPVLKVTNILLAPRWRHTSSSDCGKFISRYQK